MMYNIITFIEECIPISNGKVQQCKPTVTFAPIIFFGCMRLSSRLFSWKYSYFDSFCLSLSLYFVGA